MSRMRAGEWVAAVGAIGLLILMFFDWFALDLSPVAPDGAERPSTSPPRAGPRSAGSWTSWSAS